MFEKDGHPQLTEPVIWVEGADLQSREDCIRTDTNPSFEFCQVVVCGVFEIGGGEMCVRAADGAVHRMNLTDVESVELGERGHANVLVVVCFDRVLRIGGFGSSDELRWAQTVLSEAIADAGLPAAAGEADTAALPPSSLPLPTSGEGAGG